MKFKKIQMIRIVGLNDLLLSINRYQRPRHTTPRLTLSVPAPRQMVLWTLLVKAGEPLYPLYCIDWQSLLPQHPPPANKSPLFPVGSIIRLTDTEGNTNTYKVLSVTGQRVVLQQVP